MTCESEIKEQNGREMRDRIGIEKNLNSVCFYCCYESWSWVLCLYLTVGKGRSFVVERVQTMREPNVISCVTHNFANYYYYLFIKLLNLEVYNFN